MTHPRTLSEIWVYPIKSLGGIYLQEAVAERRGLRYDRRWMLVDESGRFVSQREIPHMAMLATAIEPPNLSVFWKNNPREKISIPLEFTSGDAQKIRVRIWDDECYAQCLPKEINQWFSSQLGEHLRLVCMPDSSKRHTDGRYAPAGQHVSFADAFPYLIIGQASLDALNDRLSLPLPMNRFRPNFVFEGGTAFEEDNWRQFSLNDHLFMGVKPCARCIIPTTNQETAERAAEPLKTLSTFRKSDNKILFGQNAVWLGEGEAVIRVGDLISHSTS